MFFNTALSILCLFPVRFIESNILHLNIDELNDNTSRIINTDSNIVNKELLDEIINVVAKQQDGLTNVAIHKCLRDEKTKAKKLLCIKNLVDKRKARSWYQSKFDIIKQDKFKTKASIDLTRSAEDRFAFDRNDFADDYIDFFSLRTGSEPNGRRNSNDFILKKILRTNYNSDSDSENSDSDDYTRMKWNPKRDSVKRFKPKKVVRKDPYSYMQAPSRIYEMNLDRRRRLPHFLPKQHHWDEDDLKNLRNYWIHGPQGKYPGPYRIPF